MPHQTETEERAIVERSVYIRKLLHRRFAAWPYQRVLTAGDDALAVRMDARQLGFARLAISDVGQHALLTSWPLIKAEVDLDPLHHYEEADTAAWTRLDDGFYTTDTDSPVARLYGWQPVAAPGIPSIDDVSAAVIWGWLGYVGGVTDIEE